MQYRLRHSIITNFGIGLAKGVPQESVIPANALLNDDGSPLLNEDGSYILNE